MHELVPSKGNGEPSPGSAPPVAGLSTIVRRLLAEHRFLRFLLIGGINTVFGYGLFYLALAVMPTTFGALSVSTGLAILFNFMTTGSYVFGSRDPRRLMRFYGVYIVAFVYNALGLALLERLAIGPRVGAILLLPGAVVLSYLLNRRYVFGPR